ncbi:MAG: nucleoside triphosphate pyrophosphohydrolase [Gemmatimonadota bacterium]|nr:nucleoside triphosphate pyrophosphohydrolase [Gemmatimonadota bacterium]
MPRTVHRNDPLIRAGTDASIVTDSTPTPESAEPRFSGPGDLDRALDLVRFLRVECSWDRAQTAESLIPHLLEETHEVVDAIHAGDASALEGELGDLLLNLAFQIVVAEEGGDLDAASVYRRLESKMVGRHPHLFGSGERRSWESLKAAERAGGEGVLSGVAKGLDPLTKAYRIQERVAGVGFDWDDYRGAFDKVAEELDEVEKAIQSELPDHVVEELGDLLFAVVNLTRLAGAHPTTALADANEKFRDRFERLETLVTARGIDIASAGLAVLDELWDEVKRG